MSGGLPFDHSQFSSLQTAPYPKIPDLGQASLTVTPVSLPLARWVRSQAPAFGHGVLDCIMLVFRNILSYLVVEVCQDETHQSHRREAC